MNSIEIKCLNSFLKNSRTPTTKELSTNLSLSFVEFATIISAAISTTLIQSLLITCRKEMQIQF